ncbi:hypothetical protein [Azospirillum endophyticum]
MTVLCITAATSILSIGLLVGFELCVDLPSNMAGTGAAWGVARSDRGRSGEDVMG